MPGSDLPERNLPLTGSADSAAAVRDAPRTVWRSASVRYGAAVLAIVTVAVIQHLAVPQQELAPFVLFFAGIALASVFGGRGRVSSPRCSRPRRATTSSFGPLANSPCTARP